MNHSDWWLGLVLSLNESEKKFSFLRLILRLEPRKTTAEYFLPEQQKSRWCRCCCFHCSSVPVHLARALKKSKEIEMKSRGRQQNPLEKLVSGIIRMTFTKIKTESNYTKFERAPFVAIITASAASEQEWNEPRLVQAIAMAKKKNWIVQIWRWIKCTSETTFLLWRRSFSNDNEAASVVAFHQHRSPLNSRLTRLTMQSEFPKNWIELN